MNKPKYNILDEVWLIINNSAKKGQITGVRFISKHSVFYEFDFQEFPEIPESRIFLTKEELIKSL